MLTCYNKNCDKPKRNDSAFCSQTCKKKANLYNSRGRKSEHLTFKEKLSIIRSWSGNVKSNDKQLEKDVRDTMFSKGNIQVKIKEPWWGAWKKFGWPRSEWGVGIEKRLVDKAQDQNKMLEVNVWKFKQKFTLDPNRVIKYCIDNKTYFTARNKTKLYVVPRFLLES